MPLKGPSVINANTTYAVDHSPENNYGLGPSFASQGTLRNHSVRENAKPSLWWLVLFAIVVVLL